MLRARGRHSKPRRSTAETAAATASVRACSLWGNHEGARALDGSGLERCRQVPGATQVKALAKVTCSNRNLAVSVARLTSAAATPGSASSAACTRPTQPPQCMPRTSRRSSGEAAKSSLRSRGAASGPRALGAPPPWPSPRPPLGSGGEPGPPDPPPSASRATLAAMKTAGTMEATAVTAACAVRWSGRSMPWPCPSWELGPVDPRHVMGTRRRASHFLVRILGLGATPHAWPLPLVVAGWSRLATSAIPAHRLLGRAGHRPSATRRQRRTGCCTVTLESLSVGSKLNE